MSTHSITVNCGWVIWKYRLAQAVPSTLTLIRVCLVIFFFTGQSAVVNAESEVLHTFESSVGQEVINVIAVDKSKLLPLLPDGFDLFPADILGFGSYGQGIVAIANYNGINYQVDQKNPIKANQVAIDVGILVYEPAAAFDAEVSILGAFHVYALAIYSNDARYVASLRRAEIPVEFVKNIDYQRDMDDLTGEGNLSVKIPSKDTPFQTNSSSQGYFPMPGTFNAIIWHQHRNQKSVLQFIDEPFKQGIAIGQVYTKPDTYLDELLSGGGLGECDPHPETGYHCVIAPALNLRYDEGSLGRLKLLRQ